MNIIGHLKIFTKKTMKRIVSALVAAIVSFLLATTVWAQTATELDAMRDTPAQIDLYWDGAQGDRPSDAPPAIPSQPVAPNVEAPAPASDNGGWVAPIHLPSPMPEVAPLVPPDAVAPQAPSPQAPQAPSSQVPSQGAVEELATPDFPIATINETSSPKIALLLPSRTPAYANASQTVLAGFMRAATAANAQSVCLVLEHGAGEFFNAYNDAIRAGARVVVGPLIRDDVVALAKTTPPLWTVALTRPEDARLSVPPNILFLTMAIESDARLLAREIALSTKAGQPVVLTSETPMMRRFTDAFLDEWTMLGKEARPERVFFDHSQLSKVKSKLMELSPSVVVLAVDGDDAALARAQTRSWVTYASAHIYRRALQFEGYALDQLRVVEIPWLIQPSSESFRALGTQPQTPMMARLFALGFDAFYVAQQFLNGSPESFNFLGASGNIYFNVNNGLARDGQLGVFDEGRLRPLGAPRR